MPIAFLAARRTRALVRLITPVPAGRQTRRSRKVPKINFRYPCCASAPHSATRARGRDAFGVQRAHADAHASCDGASRRLGLQHRDQDDALAAAELAKRLRQQLRRRRRFWIRSWGLIALQKRVDLLRRQLARLRPLKVGGKLEGHAGELMREAADAVWLRGLARGRSSAGTALFRRLRGRWRSAGHRRSFLGVERARVSATQAARLVRSLTGEVPQTPIAKSESAGSC